MHKPQGISAFRGVSMYITAGFAYSQPKPCLIGGTIHGHKRTRGHHDQCLDRATAGVLAQAGAKVSILDVKADHLQESKRETGAIPASCDVTDPDSVRTTLNSARHDNGPTRIRVNCAGVVRGGRISRTQWPDGPEQEALMVTMQVPMVTLRFSFPS